jgi:hypothetical protein
MPNAENATGLRPEEDLPKYRNAQELIEERVDDLPQE